MSGRHAAARPGRRHAARAPRRDPAALLLTLLLLVLAGACLAALVTLAPLGGVSW